jgi:hypothetical protein
LVDGPAPAPGGNSRTTGSAVATAFLDTRPTADSILAMTDVLGLERRTAFAGRCRRPQRGSCRRFDDIEEAAMINLPRLCIKT